MSRAAGTRNWTSISSVVSPNAQPARNAARFASSTALRPAKRFSIQPSVTEVGRSYSHDTSPSAKRFLARSASRAETSAIPSTARWLSVFIGIRRTTKSPSDPSSSGLDS